MKACPQKSFGLNTSLPSQRASAGTKISRALSKWLDQVKIDKALLDDILRRYSLQLPNK
jgi:hypothetical protein